MKAAIGCETRPEKKQTYIFEPARAIIVA